jgi:hypothetical protein
LPRFAVTAAPFLLWVAWNVGQYHSPFPGGGGLTVAAGGGGAGPSLSDALAAAQGAVYESFSDFWGVGYAPRVPDPRPVALLCAAFIVSTIVLLSTDAIAAVRGRLSTWLIFAAGAFLSTFGTIFLAVVRGGGGGSYTGRYFVGLAVAWAALLALTIDAAAGRRIWVARGVSIALSLVLVHFALQFSTLGFRLL